jgi:hypothetical protein
VRQTEQLVEKMASEPRHVTGRGSGRILRKSYRLGVLQGFAEKLRAAERPSDKGEGVGHEANVISSALVAFNKDNELDQYLGEVYPRLRSVRSESQRVDSSAYDAGKTAGKQITLNKPVASSAHGGVSGFLRGR